MRLNWIILLVWVSGLGINGKLFSQEVPDTLQYRPNTLGETLKKGQIDFHLRSFVMGTSNWQQLTDYFTIAAGGGLAYASPRFHGFQVGFSGFFVFQLYEHNLRIPDPSTGNVNRYEILLYDMNDFENTKDLDRLEHLFLSYTKGAWEATFGRQKVNTPFLNEQDNRMRPNVFSGLNVTYKDSKWDISGAWYNHVTMRGTVDWYSIADSYGVYPFGRNVFGTSSAYFGNISSRGLGLLGARFNADSDLKIQFWNYWAENVFSLHYMQVEKKWEKDSFHWFSGAEGFSQLSSKNGGNPDTIKAYIVPGENTWGAGARLGISLWGKQELSLNALWISRSGRFLFPREWGRETFYASLPRERFEGNGGVRSIVMKYDKQWSADWSTRLGAGSVSQPDVDNFQLNKYGVPSYYHFTADVGHKLAGNLEGLEIRFLLVNKTSKNRGEVSDQFRINRVDLWNANLIMDYRF